MSKMFPKRLLNWIKIDKLDWFYLSQNHNAYTLLIKQFENDLKNLKECQNKDENKDYNSLNKINWNCFCRNPSCINIVEKEIFVKDNINNINNIKNINNRKNKYNKMCVYNNTNGIHLIEKYPQFFEDDIKSGKYIDYISSNPTSIHILEKNLDKVNWNSLCLNINAGKILRENIDKINWNLISYNKGAIDIIEKNLDKININNLCSNENAIHLIEKFMNNIPETIDWYYLSRNANAIHILEQNIDKIKWDYLSCNPNAIHLLEKNMDKIDWEWFSKNPSIFEWCRIKYLYKKNIIQNIFIKDMYQYILDF